MDKNGRGRSAGGPCDCPTKDDPRKIDGVSFYKEPCQELLSYPETLGVLHSRSRVFSKLTLHLGDVVTDLLHALGLSMDERFKEGSAAINPSIDVEGALLIEMWRKTATPAPEIDALLYLTQFVVDRDSVSTKYFLDENSVRSIPNISNGQIKGLRDGTCMANNSHFIICPAVGAWEI